MRQSEWVEIAQRMNRLWPHSLIPDETVAEWWALMKDLDRDQVDATLTVLAMEREFPPPAGVLRMKVTELQSPAYHQEWREVWAEIMSCITRYGWRRFEADQVPFTSMAVKRLCQTSGFKELCLSDESDLPVIEAQWRNKWHAMKERDVRERAWAGLPTAGLPALERGQKPALMEDHTHGDGDQARTQD